MVPGRVVQVDRAQVDRAAFAQLYGQHFPRVLSYLFYRVHDPPLVDDLTAQVFERALARWEQYDPERGTFSTWLFGTARNSLKWHGRRQSVRRRVPLDTIRSCPSPAPAVEEVVAQNGQPARLLPLVCTLGEREQSILALEFGVGLTNRRTAEIIGLTANHVGVLAHRSLQRVREGLSEEENQNPNEERIRQLNGDIDQLLQEPRAAIDPGDRKHDEELLAVARVLAQADVAALSRSRLAARQRLLSERNQPRRTHLAWRPLLAGATAVLILVAVVTMPPLRLMAQDAGRGIGRPLFTQAPTPAEELSPGVTSSVLMTSQLQSR